VVNEKDVLLVKVEEQDSEEKRAKNYLLGLNEMKS